MTRPTEIVWFERIIIATLALGALNSWLAWPQLVAMRGPAYVITVQLFAFAVMLGLTLLVSRRRSNVAKWISIAMFIIGLPFWVQQVSAGSLPGSLTISFVQVAAQVVAFALLFTAASRRCFKREAVAAPA